MNVIKVKKALLKGNKDEMLIIFADYICWQLERMSNKELAETTADEIIKGVFTLDKIYKACENYARSASTNKRSAAVPAEKIFEVIRKELKIFDAVSPEEAHGFYGGMPVNSAPCDTRTTAVDIDLDDLF